MTFWPIGPFLVGVRVPSAGSDGEGSGLPDVVLVNNFVEIIKERVPR